MDKQQTLTDFWNSFNIPAYDENTVPDEKDRIEANGQAFPYITYETSTDSFNYLVSCSASVWYRDTGWQDVTQKAEEIGARISRGGIMLNYDDGAIWLSKGSPWSRRMSDPDDDMVRRIVLNFNVEYMD